MNASIHVEKTKKQRDYIGRDRFNSRELTKIYFTKNCIEREMIVKIVTIKDQYKKAMVSPYITSSPLFRLLAKAPNLIFILKLVDLYIYS